jgi:prepilin-type N-terminal cleavage/methylation domain-containing protein
LTLVQNARARDRGFTLAELLVVIVVLGVLSTVVVFAVGGVRSSADDSACAADRATLVKAEEAYRATHDVYATEAQLVGAKLLRAHSTRYDIVASSDTFDVAPTVECAGASTPSDGGPVAAANTLTLAAMPTSVVAGSVITPAITVSVHDAAGLPVTTGGLPVTIALASSSAVLSGTLTVNTVDGVATFADLVIDESGAGFSFVASMAGAVTTTGPSFAVASGLPTKLTILQQPAGGVTGSAWLVQPIVAVQDALGNTVTASVAPVTLAITPGTGTAGAALTCTTNPVSAYAGVAAYAGCKIGTAGTGYTLTASSPGLSPATTSSFGLTGPATKLVITQQPTNVVAGAMLAPAVTVTVQDAANRIVTSSTATVTITVSTNPGSSTLAGTASAPVVNGVATFSNLTLNRPGTGYKLTAASSGLTAAVSSAFNVTIGTASKLVVTQQPAGAKAGVAFTTQPKVTVQDAAGNTITTSTAPITLAVTSGTGTAGATLACTSNPVNAVAGVATLAGCKIATPGSAYTITASSPGLTDAVSAVFDNPAGTATKLVITQQPANVVAGAAIAPAVTVAVQDAVGNTVTTSTATVTLTISTNPGVSTLSGTVSATVVNGIATFADLSLNKVGTGYKLTAASTGLTAAVSTAFNVTVGAPAKLAVTQQPAGAKAGVAFTTQPKVTVQDALGNTITTSTAPITLAITNGTGTAGASLACTTNPINAVAGVATFAACKIATIGTGYTLTATSPDLTDAVSAVFDNPVGAATKLVIAQQPTNVVAGASITPGITVTVQDVAGNTVTSSAATVTMTVSTNPGTSTLSGTVSATVVNGVATFSNLSLNKVGTGYKLTAASTGLTSAVSGTFNVTVGAPAKLAFTTQPGGGAVNAVWATAVQPKVTVQDAFGNTITTSTVSVTLAITSGAAGSTLTCTNNPKAAAAGIVTYAGCKINMAGTGYTLTATATGLTAATSSTFTIT